jgi:prepilin peptidase dependent protein B
MFIAPPDRGFTLIELMLGLLLGLIVLGGVLGVFVTTYQSSSQDIKRVRLNEEMRAVMEMMSRDLRRAGSWQRDATSWSVTMANPFANNVNWKVSKYAAASPADSCVLFAYGIGTIQNAERFGYRLRPPGGGISAPRVETYNHTDGDWNCAGARWQPVSDGSVVAITDLDFAVSL